jgi:hypothetical protein
MAAQPSQRVADCRLGQVQPLRGAADMPLREQHIEHGDVPRLKALEVHTPGSALVFRHPGIRKSIE